jgi:transposase InsO family protein
VELLFLQVLSVFAYLTRNSLVSIFSRYAVAWMVADRENSALAGRLIEETCQKQGVQPQVLTLHSDRGAPCRASARLSFSPTSVSRGP